MHTIVNHPLVQHKLSILRDVKTDHAKFAQLVGEISRFLTYEAFRDIDTEECLVQTPLAEAKCRRLTAAIAVAPILRAGVGMLDGVLSMVPNACVGFIGMYRDERTTRPIQYYCKLPAAAENSVCVLLDPMLATGGSSCEGIHLVKQAGFQKVVFLCIVACPEGMAALEKAHPDVPVFAAAMDDGLNERHYILPGLGDAGDRLFGTL